MKQKFPGKQTDAPLGYDHVALAVDSKEDLFAFKDRLEAAGFDVHGAVDHGLIWSIYFYDPNNIPLEVTWQFMDVTRPPAMCEDDPMAIVAEGPKPQPGVWPEPTRTAPPPEEMVARSGNGHPMREQFLSEGSAVYSPGHHPVNETS